jgi:hypothetical protein
MHTKESLAQLGKDASDLYLRHGMPLADAIVKVASARGDLSKEHVQRIIENANLVTFEELFKTGPSKHVTFDLADPDDVHARMSGGHEPAGDLHSYLTPPDQRDPDDSVDDSADSTDDSDDGFGAAQKHAHLVPDHVQWRRDYYATRAAVDTLAKQASAYDAEAEAAVHNFVQMAKRASLQGGIKPVLQLAGFASQDAAVFTKIAHVVAASLPADHREGEYSESAPNRDHPLCAAYAQAEAAIKLAAHYRSGLINAERLHQRVLTERA